jgi:hypothetical protein
MRLLVFLYCWLAGSSATRTESVVVFPLQQRLRERAAMLYVHCISSFVLSVSSASHVFQFFSYCPFLIIFTWNLLSPCLEWRCMTSSVDCFVTWHSDGRLKLDDLLSLYKVRWRELLLQLYWLSGVRRVTLGSGEQIGLVWQLRF